MVVKHTQCAVYCKTIVMKISKLIMHKFIHPNLYHQILNVSFDAINNTSLKINCVLFQKPLSPQTIINEIQNSEQNSP